MIYSITFKSMANVSNLLYYYRQYQGVDLGITTEVHKKQKEAFNSFALLAELIKTTEDNTFGFVIVKNQEAAFDAWVKEYSLEEYIVYRMPYFVTNGNHSDVGRNLKLVFMATSKHVWREMYE